SAEGLPHFRAGARTNDQRNDTKDERERSHQDRAQSKTTRFDRGGETVFLVAILNLFCEFDDKDRVLTSESNQHNEADLGKDVVLHRAQPDTVDRAEETHRNDQNDCEWQRPTLVKRREQQKNEQNRSEEHTSELQSLAYLVCRLLLEKKKHP